jgi:diamine N-acetyltransferase
MRGEPPAAMMSAMTVQLREITDANRNAVLALRVAPNQEHLADGVGPALAEAAADPTAHPWYRAVYADDEPVGFVMLADDVPPGHPLLPYRYYLWRLLIDARHQRRGHGHATLDAIVAYLHTRPGAHTLVTSVAPAPTGPLGFYLNYGFTDTGEMFDHERLLTLQLHPHGSPKRPPVG